MDHLERIAARRCADAVAALQAVASLLEAGEPVRVPDVDPVLRLTAAVEAVRVAERAAQELRALLVELAMDHGAEPAVLGYELED
ncbi:MAG TPA: hypothetical protein VGP02_12230 [Mycobacteriales bacterium]|nr:hypothetical protein [Mycobacteriales bacterium]